MFQKFQRKLVVKQQKYRSVKKTSTIDGFDAEANTCAFIPIHYCADVAMMEDFMDQGLEDGPRLGLGSGSSSHVDFAGDYYNPMTNSVYRRPTGLAQQDAEMNTGPVGASYAEGTFTDDNYLCEFSKLRSWCVIRNLDIHPIDVTLYECVAKESRSQQAAYGNTEQQLVRDLDAGFRASEAATEVAAGVTGAAGDALYSNEAAATGQRNHVKSLNLEAQPGHSSVFNNYWKINKSKKYRLQPGDEISWSSPSKRYTFSPKVLYQADASENTLIIKGVTTVLLAKVVGILGRSKVAGEHTTVGTMNAEIAWKKGCAASLLPRLGSFHKGIRATIVTHDDLTGKTLEGPAVHFDADNDGD